jgi:hypothetical protein
VVGKAERWRLLAVRFLYAVLLNAVVYGVADFAIILVNANSDI